MLRAPLLLLALGLVGCHTSTLAAYDGGSAPEPADAGGAVYIWEGPNGSGSVSYGVVAVFPDVSGGQLCAGASQDAGACCFLPADGGTAAPAVLYDVGEVRVSNATQAAALATLDWLNPLAGYPPNSWSQAWRPGDVLEVTAPGPGNGVPGFDLKATAPGPITGISPAWGAPIDISRASDFVVRWTPDPTGDGGTRMRLVLFGESAQGQTFRGMIGCEAADTAGTLTVPSALLQNFSAGDTCQICSNGSCSGCFMARGVDGVDGGYLLRVQTTLAPNTTFQATFQ